jgi:hypothetical protein
MTDAPKLATYFFLVICSTDHAAQTHDNDDSGYSMFRSSM